MEAEWCSERACVKAPLRDYNQIHFGFKKRRRVLHSDASSYASYAKGPRGSCLGIAHETLLSDSLW